MLEPVANEDVQRVTHHLMKMVDKSPDEPVFVIFYRFYAAVLSGDLPFMVAISYANLTHEQKCEIGSYVAIAMTRGK